MDGLGAEEYGDDAEALIVQVSQGQGEQIPPPSKWLSVCRRQCEFNPTHFYEAMLNAIRNPNLLSSWLFRADLLAEHDGTPPWQEGQPRIPVLRDMRCERVFVRRLIPRNTKRDSPIVQTCPFYSSTEQAGDSGISRRLVLYLPHVSNASEVPYYHPQVTGVGLLHEWDARLSKGSFSVHYRLFDNVPMDARLQRTALNILSVLHKLGQGQLNGYVKRVHHDILVPQPVLQDRYSRLKDKFAKRLVDGWLETTDPAKHVFEDLGIAAFLIELWAEMYKEQGFPGFVDIGTGNGLLVHILNSEGFRFVRSSPSPQASHRHQEDVSLVLSRAIDQIVFFSFLLFSLPLPLSICQISSLLTTPVLRGQWLGIRRAIQEILGYVQREATGWSAVPP